MAKNVILNGRTVEGMPKMVKLPINGKEVNLTLVYIVEGENGTNWEWQPVSGNNKLICKSQKMGNRVANTLEFEGKTIFTNLTAQSVFAVILAKFSQPKSTTDSIYKKCNPERKEGKGSSGSSKMVITENGNW